MLNNYFHKLLCNVGHHDFERTARWCSPDHSMVVVEDICKYCGEDAYMLTAFLPKICTVLKRYPTYANTLINMTNEGTCCDGCNCEKTSETKSKAQRKPRSTGSKAKIAKAA